MSRSDHSDPSPPPQRKRRLNNGVEAHVLTAEDRRRGAATTNAKKAELAKSFRERLAEKLDAEADVIIGRLLAASQEDWRAITAALDQAFGRPSERHELTGPDGGPMEVTAQDVSAAVERFTAAVVQQAARKPADEAS